jgi:hypothetical protein
MMMLGSIPQREANKHAARLYAHKAVVFIRRGSLTTMATWNGNLDQRCLEGVAEFERLRPRVKPATKLVRCCSLMVQQAAEQFAAASHDNVLTVLIARPWTTNGRRFAQLPVYIRNRDLTSPA